MSEKKIDIDKVININKPERNRRRRRNRRRQRRGRRQRKAIRVLKRFNKMKEIDLGKHELMSFNPVSLREVTFGKATKIVNSYSRYLALSYIFGLIHPDSAVKNKIAVKAPSPLPIPTTCFGFKETHTITTNNSGRFALVWSPEYLGSSEGVASYQGSTTFPVGRFANIYINNNDALLGDGPDNHFTAHWFREVVVPFSKYRLTSAMIKVRYTGNVYQQAGVMSSCATYIPFDRLLIARTSSQADPSYYNDSMAQMGNFDVIKNGQWNQTLNITADANGLRALYVPTDGLSSVFCNDACTASTTPTLITAGGSVAKMSIKSENTKLSYAFVGHGLQPSSPCITVEAYYNYEIIVKPDMMPYFQNGNIVPVDKQVAEAGYREVSNLAAQDGLIRQWRNDVGSNTVGNKWKNFLTKSAQFIGNKVVPAVQTGMKIAGLISQII